MEDKELEEVDKQTSDQEVEASLGEGEICNRAQRLLRGVQRVIPALGDQRLRGCDGCEEYRDFYVHWETIGCRVAVVTKSTEIYTCTG